MSSILKNLSVVGLLWLAMSVQAKVGTISIGELAQGSDLILVAEVQRVEVKAGVKIARVRVIRFVKGKAECPIAFVAEPTWACDTSAALPGKRVLLYLTAAVDPQEQTLNGKNVRAVQASCKREGTQLYVLSHSGRGRIPLSLNKGQWVAPVTRGDARGPGLNLSLYIPRPVTTVLTSPGHRAVPLAELITRFQQPVAQR